MRSVKPKLGEGDKEKCFPPVILGMDPGTYESAWAVYDPATGKLEAAGQSANRVIATMLKNQCAFVPPGRELVLVIEMLKSYGNALGDSVLETCVWIGRFIEAWGRPAVRLPRKTIVTQLCNNPRANDTNVRAELMNRFGRSRDRSIGTKAAPGPLYCVKRDMWSALAVAIVYADLLALEQAGVPTYLTTAKEVWHEVEEETDQR